MGTEVDDFQSVVLEDLTEAVNYRHWLADLARPYLGDHPIEIGSGLGHYATEWLPSVQQITVTEADPPRLAVLEQRFRGDPRVTVRELTLPTQHQGEYSAFVALNVFEHIEDDVAAMRSAASLVRSGGAVVILVPAFNGAMSRFDREIGHYRRYTTAMMRSKVEAAGFSAEVVRYVNPLGLIGWWAVCKVLRRHPKNGPLLRLYDRMLVPVLRALDRGRPAFGQSVFCVIRVP